MQNDTPLANDSLSPNGVLGDNLELLLLHKAYLDLVNDEENEEGTNDDEN